MSPKLQNEIDKGLKALSKKDYEVARAHLTKAAQLAPNNVDVRYLLGVSELGLGHKAVARSQFESALKLNPSYQRALLALGELELESGDTEAAIASLEKACAVDGAGWQALLQLSAAYARAGRLLEAEQNAARAVELSKDKSPTALLLLATIYSSEGKRGRATESYQRFLQLFPNDPGAAEAKRGIAGPTAKPEPSLENAAANLPLPSILPPQLSTDTERPWAPPDTDSVEYRLAENAPCQVDELLARTWHHVNAQMQNFEKFTATERIEHQDIDRHGTAGAVRAKDFSYIVFVHNMNGKFTYLEELRDGGTDLSNFPTSLATTGLNGLGVSVLQPSHREFIRYQCEGLTSIRGKAAWQVRFEEDPDSKDSVRMCSRNGVLYKHPAQGPHLDCRHQLRSAAH